MNNTQKLTPITHSHVERGPNQGIAPRGDARADKVHAAEPHDSHRRERLNRLGPPDLRLDAQRFHGPRPHRLFGGSQPSLLDVGQDDR
jgi:hypothetical protein